MQGEPDSMKVTLTTKWVERALDNNFQFRSEFLGANKEWTVVPVESASHFDEHDAERISKAASLAGKSTLYAVRLEELKCESRFVEVAVSKDGLLLFSRQYGLYNYAMIADDFTFAIICTTDDYFLLAGPRRFVEIAVGKDVLEARAEFEAFAKDDSWSDSDRSWLTEISRRYA